MTTGSHRQRQELDALFEFVTARASEAVQLAVDELGRRGCEQRLRILDLMRAHLAEFPQAGDEVARFLLRSATNSADHPDYRAHWALGLVDGQRLTR